MNIFLPDESILGSVRALDDRRVNKMIVETAQMLSTVLGGKLVDERLYKATHQFHPCTIWLGKTVDNFLFGIDYGRALLAEFRRRGGKKDHKTSAVYDAIEDIGIDFVLNPLRPRGLQPFVNATTNHKHVADVHEAYRQELYLKWVTADPRYFPTWKLGMPSWLTPMQLGYIMQLQEQAEEYRFLTTKRNKTERRLSDAPLDATAGLR